MRVPERITPKVYLKGDKHTMICKKCGANLPDGVKFCTECGAKIEVEEITAPQNDAPMNDQVQQAP